MDQLIKDYLGRLETAARALPPDRRAELLAEIEDHITIMLAEHENPSEATLRNVLDRLGSPAEIALEAGADPEGVSPPDGRSTVRGVGALESVTVILLLIGGIVLPVLGWIVGAVLLWSSARWTSRDKLIGTLVFPGGLAVLAWFFFSSPGPDTICSPGGACETSGGMSAGLAFTIALVGTAGSIGSAAHLLRRASRFP